MATIESMMSIEKKKWEGEQKKKDKRKKREEGKKSLNLKN